MAVVGVVLVGVAAGIGSAAATASDLRLKRDVRPAGTLPNGLKLYAFRYWNDDRTFVGVVAQDLLEDARFRHAVSRGERGYYLVDLNALGLGIAGDAAQFQEAGQRAVQSAEPVVD